MERTHTPAVVDSTVLYVMRHGPAFDSSESGRDSDRALTVEGRERVLRVARALRDGGEVPRRIVSSPLVRALQTAELVAGEMRNAGPHGAHARGESASEPLGMVHVHSALAPTGRAAKLVHEHIWTRTPSVGPSLGPTLVVGHEPELSGLVHELTGRAMPVGMSKGMVVALSFGSPATVRFILDPKTLVWEVDTRDAARAGYKRQ